MLRTASLSMIVAAAAVDEASADEVVSLLQLNADWRAGSRARHDFEAALCSSPTALNFRAATLLHSNLGGHGPHAGDAKLVFANVAPGVNLEVTNTSEYTPFQNANGGVKHNKLFMGFGQINVATDTTVDLKFRFVDAITGELTDQLGRYAFTVVDADGGAAEGASESVTMSGYESYAAGDDVDVDERSAFAGTFSSLMRGGKIDNPLGPMEMNQLQERRSIGFVFENPEFSMTVAESNYANPQGRNIVFTGATGALCGEQAKCTSLDCKEFGMMPHADAEFLTCKSGQCSESDKDYCCQASEESLLEVKKWRAGSRSRHDFETVLCSSPTALNFRDSTVEHSNLGGYGPDAGDAKLVLANVAPNVNLEVTNTSEYTPFQDENGGVNHNKLFMGFGQINVATDTTVDLKFRFVDASTGEPTDQLGRYAFTVVDTDGGAAEDSSESVTMSGYESYAAGDDVDVDERSAFAGTFTSLMRGGKIDNPLGPMEMNRLQERRSVGFVFENPEFSMTVAESNYANPQGRNIFFTGATGALCGEQAKCTSLNCKQFGMLPQADAEFLACKSGHCSESDKDFCCRATSEE